MIDCAGNDSLTGLPLFPLASTLTSCTSIDAHDMDPIWYPCPSPLEFNPSTSLSSPCQLPCISLAELVFDDSQTLHDMFVTWSILSWISIFCVLLVILIFLSFRLGRSWPHRITIYLGLAHFWCHLTGVGGSFFTLEDLLCENRFDFAFSGWVKFQAWSIYFGSLSTACWWLVQGATIFWNITLLRTGDDLPERYEPLLHLLCWGYPFLVACILTWIPSGMASGGSPSGFPFGTATPDSSIGLMWGLYNGVYCGFILLNVTAITTALIRILFTPFANKHIKTEQTRRFSAELLIVVFMIVFLNLIVAFVAVASYKTEKGFFLQESLFQYQECLLNTFLGSSFPNNCERQFTFNSFYFWYQNVTWGRFGLFFALIFLILKVQTREHIAGALKQWLPKAKSRVDSIIT